MNRKQRRAEKTEINADALFDAALEHHEAGRRREAEALYRKVLALQPRDAEALHLLGVLAYDDGRLDTALDLIGKAIAINATVASFHCNLGNTLRGLGRLDPAVASFRRALALRPDFPEAQNGLGNALAAQRQWEAAIACYRRALALQPNYAEALSNLGAALTELGHAAEAMACYRKAIALRPDFARAYNNLAGLHLRQGRFAEAAADYRHAVTLGPDVADFHSNLGHALHQLSRLAEAEASCRRALALRPDLADAHNNLGNVLKDQARLSDALHHYAQARALTPGFFGSFSNQLLVQNFLEHTPPQMRALAEAFGAQVTSQVSQAFTAWAEPAPGAPLRVGLVSGDFWGHPVGFFLEGLLRAADPARLQFIAFPTSPRSDELTARIRPLFADWAPVLGLEDEAAARLIHSKGVHVLLDLSGHTAWSRLSVFGWRPAPVQAAWLGYFATTGVAEIDYIIADPQVAPPAEEAHFTETVWRLPEVYYCFTPPDADVEVSALPALANGYVTFGCFNNLTKLNDAVIATWARVLQAVPGSRLLLKAQQLGDQAVRDATLARFAAQGIPAGRLDCEGASPRAEYLRSYHRVDIALDPFPFPGGTTSCELLWMGVPLLTKRGDRFLSHVGETIVLNAGLPDWIADDADDYVARAARFAADLPALSALRARLRPQVLASPLFDAARFARHFEAAMWGMWPRR
jgi:predicted O-linked N-acetylglucosamine transferase (SPINDLY family)